jgi:hypothetical protein
MAYIDDLHARYLAALHAVQTGIEYKRQYDRKFVEEKHMRAGVDSAHVTNSATAKLLIAKGVFTEEEYFEMLAAEAEHEKARYEQELSEHFRRTIKLG